MPLLTLLTLIQLRRGSDAGPPRWQNTGGLLWLMVALLAEALKGERDLERFAGFFRISTSRGAAVPGIWKFRAPLQSWPLKLNELLIFM